MVGERGVVTPAGRIDIHLTVTGESISGVRLASSRPIAATQILHGLSARELLHTLPVLFSVCGNAQAYAARQACRAVLDHPETIASESARQILVLAECMRELAWRILLDWPEVLAEKAEKAAMATLLRSDDQLKRILFKDGDAFSLSSTAIASGDVIELLDDLRYTLDKAVFAGSLATVLQIADFEDWKDWWRYCQAPAARLMREIVDFGWADLGRNSVELLPPLPAAKLATEIGEAPSEFCRAPRWQARCWETTVLNRQSASPAIAGLSQHYGNGLLVRIAARLRELAELPIRMSALTQQLDDTSIVPPPFPVADGLALSQVVAARGLLLHRLDLRQGRVYDYRIVAPTEWNFHPDGVVAQGLYRLHGDSETLKRQASLWIAAIDPCVEYRLEWDYDTDAC